MVFIANQQDKLWFWALESQPLCFGPLNHCTALVFWALNRFLLGTLVQKPINGVVVYMALYGFGFRRLYP